MLALRLSIAELRHERLFAIGVVLAVCSVLTPILVLWGLKNGIIDSMRQRLITDPRVREIRPIESVDVPSTWVAGLRADPRTAFIVPSVRQISLYGRLRSLSTARWFDVDEILPSAAGDPLADVAEMNWQGGGKHVPCMISDRLAELMGIQPGQVLKLEVTRAAPNEQQQRALVELRIVAVIPSALSPLNSLYLPLAAIESIEDYKDGNSASLFGWPALHEQAVGRFHGFIARVDSRDGADSLGKILSELLPDAGVSMVDAAHGRIFTDLPLDEAGQLVQVAFESPIVDLSLMQTVLKKLGRRQLNFIPFVKPCDARMSFGDGSSSSVISIRTGSDRWFGEADLTDVFSGKLPKVVNEQALVRVDLQGKGFASQFHLNLPNPVDLVLNVSPQLAGLLGAGVARGVTYDQRTGAVFFPRQNYSGFRLYARTIDDVKDLRRKVELAGVKVRTHEDRIDQVKSLDAALTKLFLLVAGMGIFGGVGALSASLYLSVERGKRQFCVLQVLGVSRATVNLVIILQGGMIALSGTAIAMVLYFFCARLLGTMFADAVGPGEVLCRLNPSQLMLVAGAVACLGAIVGLLSSFRLRGLDAAAIARSE